MSDEQLFRHIQTLCPNAHPVVTTGRQYLFYDDEWTAPFASITTSDAYDTASGLYRDGVYRLNISVGLDAYVRLFGPPPPMPEVWRVTPSEFDFRELDRLMPHPMYGPRSWVCVLNPSAATVLEIEPLLVEAYDVVVKQAEESASLRLLESLGKRTRR